MEDQLLYGDGNSPNLEGITTGATAFDSATYLVASDGYEFADCLHAAATQLRVAGFACDTFIVNPINWASIERQKTSEGLYIFGGPRTVLAEALWNRQVVISPALTVNTFVALDSRHFHIRQRMATVVEVSFEHSSNWTSNLATLRAETRLALVCDRVDALVSETSQPREFRPPTSRLGGATARRRVLASGMGAGAFATPKGPCCAHIGCDAVVEIESQAVNIGQRLLGDVEVMRDCLNRDRAAGQGDG